MVAQINGRGIPPEGVVAELQIEELPGNYKRNEGSCAGSSPLQNSLERGQYGFGARTFKGASIYIEQANHTVIHNHGKTLAASSHTKTATV